MKPLYTQEIFDKTKSSELLPFECYQCQTIFYTPKSQVKSYLKRKLTKNRFCSHDCAYKAKITRQIIHCTNCNKAFELEAKRITKSINHFCSQSCSGSYLQKNKTHGTRRSKLETWIEHQLTTLYPNIEFHFNRKDTIGSELDIYIPSLRLAFELNGIFHYEPIYGPDRLDKIKTNDISKSKACHEAEIDLCIIDTSTQTKFNPSSSNKYLNIITSIISTR